MIAGHATKVEGDGLPPLPPAERLQALLFDAARLGRDDVIPALLGAGADVEGMDERGHTPLVLASYHGHETTTSLLLEFGAAVDGTVRGAGSGSPLMGVAFKGYTAIARLLLKAGADPNFRNGAGQTPLMMAALFSRRDIIDMLVEAGADPLAVDAAGNDAPALALSQGNNELAEELTALQRVRAAA
ncbi:ankyrin repeat domain-containing protein [Novosphingobium panipatense]|uniref:ankyrin repeat domain-containing protein n=1 Tax=Novosphingobium TaxID=165696 RepID=UPI0018ECE17E|nr:ankyrin repeat domain-containing protein [Novosphingobium sp. HII-3]